MATTTTEEFNKRTDTASNHSSADLNDTAKLEAIAERPELTRTDSQYEYPPAAQGALIMACIMLAVFLVALDRTIIATAVPSITNEFNSLDDIGWYGSSFLLTACTFQLLLGRIYTFYTPKYVYLVVIFIFEAASALCGAAPNSVAFIIGRAIAGAASGGIMSGGIILMTNSIPLAKRPLYQGLFGAVFGIASILGPLVGGAFTTNVTWRWCFYLNLPIGAVVWLVLLFVLKPDPPSKGGMTLTEQFKALDPLGNLFLFPSIICLLLALQWGGTTYAWNDGKMIALLTLFSVFFLAFVAIQILMPTTATIPAAVVKNRNVIAGMFLSFCFGSTMMVFIYYVPIWFQAVKGQSAVQSGIDILPMVLSLVIGSIVAGVFTGKVGYYKIPAIASAIVMPIGAGLISTFNLETSEGKWIGYQILYGFGVGMGMQQGNLAVQTVLSRQLVPIGISLCFFWQMLSGAIFISVAQNILDQNLVRGILQIVPTLSPVTIVNTGATTLRNLIPADMLPAVLGSYNEALRQVFFIGVGISSAAVIGAFALEWKNVKTAKDGKVAVKAQAGTSEKATVAQEPVEQKV